ncbi:aminopeptidase [Niabella ginsenosidivorans]|uniref:Aminopeptidase N n=1 Tax=Niabella ginsenosidivorans TaxID=1176587 RepID=A0A1A9I3Z0_9BACT|nr:M1 family aminopeptidase [Niabella ginsenosidivorans]ANH81401.1 aminopeptidase [Niabella ginsenosidivorans]
MKWKLIYVAIILFPAVLSCHKKEKSAGVSQGVSDTLAAYRKSTLKNIRYHLQFNIPEEKDKDIVAGETVSFTCDKKPQNFLAFDFKEDPGKIKKIWSNNQEIPIVFDKEHLIIDKAFLQRGANTIRIDFIAGNGALNRRGNYLYTLFVPDRARTVFPCFDQPDLKAVFTLSITIPQSWAGIANGKLTGVLLNGNRKTLDFAPTDQLPTYLFSFAAGKFNRATEQWKGSEIELLYRETDSEKVATSLQPIFEQYKKYVTFYEQWTGIPFPFQKHGMVAIPDFQFGGMEHPGAILLQSATLFLTKDATDGQLNNRAQLLAHEVAHMWFGDLVTMNWFSDVWMKEVFANFMADKATIAPDNAQGFALKFLTDHLPYAYATDRTPGANPIRQPLDNLENAGTLYGNIIYHKAPVMMRQLEKLMGEDPFKTGVREYLRQYAYNNASWPDLINLLAKHTPVNLQAWNKVWVNEPGRPVFDYTIRYEKTQIAAFTIAQKPESGNDRVWQQSFDISFYYDNGLVKTINVNDSLALQSIDRAFERKRPRFIQFNASGLGYGVWPVDTAMCPRLFTIRNYINRASAYITLYENMLNSRYKNPEELLQLFTSGLSSETVELNIRLLTGYISTIYWEFLLPATRQSLAAKLEGQVWTAMNQQKNPNNKKMLFGCYQNLFETAGAVKKMYTIWNTQQPPPNVVLKEDDYTNLAFALVLRSNDPSVLQQQLSRIKDPDRRKRFELIMPALSADTAVRKAFFEGLSKRANRSNESAVSVALSYLHHPLRQPSAELYLEQTLELLPEIQQTGDIFFPGNWLQASFGYYQSKTAYAIVEQFLQKHPRLQDHLKAKILQSTDNLRRARTIAR